MGATTVDATGAADVRMPGGVQGALAHGQVLLRRGVGTKKDGGCVASVGHLYGLGNTE